MGHCLYRWLETCGWVKDNTASAPYSCSWLHQCVRRVVTLVMTAQTMSLCYEHSLRNVQIYLQTKFRWDISIHGRVITTSHLWKRTSSILEFYFWFRFWDIYCHGHGILHRGTKFYSNWSTYGGVITSHKFPFYWKMGQKCAMLFSRPSKSTSLPETTPFHVLVVKISVGVLAVGWQKNPQKTSLVT